MRQIKTVMTIFLAVTAFAATLDAQDWTRFRGPNGSGISPSDASLPIEWSEDKNMKWSIDLPGPGHLSLIHI